MDARQALRWLRLRLRLVLVGDAAARIIGWGLLILGAVAVLDLLAPLPVGVRVLVLLLVLAAGCVLLWRRVVRPLRRTMDDRSLAQVVERRLPLEGRLFTAIDGLPLLPAEEQRLRDALAPGQLLGLLRLDRLGRHVVAAAGIIIAIAIAAWWSPATAGIATARIISPWSGIEWPRETVLEAGVARAVVPADEPVVVEVRRSAGPAGTVSVSWSDAAGRGDRRELSGRSGPWRESLPLDAGNWVLRVAGGDALARELPVRVVTRPTVQPRRIVLVPPAYTGRGEEVLSTLATEAALPGSRLRFDLELLLDAGRDGEQVALRHDGQSVTVQRDGARLRSEIELRSAGRLELDLAARYELPDGSLLVAARPAPAWRLGVGEDLRPTVRLGGPRRDEQVLPSASVAIAIDAADDLGLARLQLTGGTAAATAAELASFADVAGQREAVRRVRLSVARFGGPGTIVELEAAAWDANDVTGPGIGRSETLRLRIVAEPELRQELERQLAEVRDRLGQARGDLAPALTADGQVREPARAAGSQLRRQRESLDEVRRRWRDNGLEADRGERLDAVAKVLAGTAAPALAAAGAQGDRQAARAADTALGDAERQLQELLRDDDLVRELRQLLQRQEQLARETAAFVLANLGGLPAAQRAHLDNLVVRQNELVERVRAWSLRLLAAPAAENIDKAKELTRRERPADRLSAASANLLSSRGRQAAAQAQAQGVEILRQLLALLEGSKRNDALAEAIGRLAEQQERLHRDTGSASLGQLRPQQERLGAETDAAGNRVEDPEAKKLLDAARDAQNRAAQAMARGDRSAAERETGAAATLLRQLQQRLQGQDQQQEEQKAKAADVLALLRQLRDEQAIVVRDTSLLHAAAALAHAKAGGQGEYQRLGLGQLRDLQAIAQREGEVLLRLEEEGLKELQQNPIALRALERVAAALRAADSHYKANQLGERGVRLAKIGLAEIERLLEIARTQIASRPQEGSGEGGGGGGSGPSPAFPPEAELKLLRAEQMELALRAMAGEGAALAPRQAELVGLVAAVAQASRPGSRPQMLLQRARRAMLSAEELLRSSPGGNTVLDEQDLAVATLTRLLEEAAQSGGGGGGGGQQNPERQPGQGKPPPGGGDQRPSGSRGQGGGNAQGGNAQGAGDGDGGAGRGVDTAAGVDGIQLPPAARERLNEALDERLPPAARQLYRRYLELLAEDFE
jgi:hypothetical protein